MMFKRCTLQDIDGYLRKRLRDSYKTVLRLPQSFQQAYYGRVYSSYADFSVANVERYLVEYTVYRHQVT